jgi:hypothetical protein
MHVCLQARSREDSRAWSPGIENDEVNGNGICPEK